MVFSHPGVAPKPDNDISKLPEDGRIVNHKFFMMLRAIRSYQDRYLPKVQALDLNLIESRCLIVMSDLGQVNADGLLVHVNAPIDEVNVALVNLSNRGMIAPEGDGFALTAQGQSKADECWKVAGAHAEDAFDGFTEAQMETFTTVLKGLL